MDIFIKNKMQIFITCSQGKKKGNISKQHEYYEELKKTYKENEDSKEAENEPTKQYNFDPENYNIFRKPDQIGKPIEEVKDEENDNLGSSKDDSLNEEDLLNSDEDMKNFIEEVSKERLNNQMSEIEEVLSKHQISSLKVADYSDSQLVNLEEKLYDT
jgi:hypothetical protein